MLFMNRNRFLMIPLVLAVAGSMGLSGCRKNSDEENMVMDAGPSVETAVRTDIENVYTREGKDHQRTGELHECKGRIRFGCPYY